MAFYLLKVKHLTHLLSNKNAISTSTLQHFKSLASPKSQANVCLKLPRCPLSVRKRYKAAKNNDIGYVLRSLSRLIILSGTLNKHILRELTLRYNDLFF